MYYVPLQLSLLQTELSSDSLFSTKKVLINERQSPECYLRSCVQLTDSKSDFSGQMWLLEAIGKGLGNHTSYRVTLEEESMKATKGGASNEA